MSVIDPGHPSAKLQIIVDDMRAELRKGMGGFFRIVDERCPGPVNIDVTPDGITWLVTVKCGERTIWTTGDALSVKPDEFISGLYVFVVACLKAAGKPSPAAPRAS